MKNSQRKRLIVAAAFLQNEMMQSRTGGCSQLMTLATSVMSSASLARAVTMLAAIDCRGRQPRASHHHRSRRSAVDQREPSSTPIIAVSLPSTSKAVNALADDDVDDVDIELAYDGSHKQIPVPVSDDAHDDEDLNAHVGLIEATPDELALRASEPPICHVDDHSFKEHFGMDKTRLEQLFREIHERVQKVEDERPGHAFFNPSPWKILLTAWLLCTRESFQGVAERFFVSKGGVHVIFVNTCRLIVNTLKSRVSFCQWPDDVTRNENADLLESKTAMPGVVGALGELRIRESVKIGSKISPTVTILQAVCDVRNRFINLYVSDPEMHAPSMRILAQTPLLSKLSSVTSSDPSYHLIADASYPLMTTLLTPYSDDQLSALDDGRDQHIAYNQAHAAAMGIAERTFARLRTRFRRIDKLHMSRSDLVSIVVKAICCLHNYIVLHEKDDVEQTITGTDSSDGFSATFDEFTPNGDAVIKRDRLAQTLYAKMAVSGITGR